MPQGLDNILRFFNPAALPYALLVAAVAAVVVRVLDRTFDRLADTFTTQRMRLHRLDTLTRFAVYSVAGFIALSSLVHLTAEGLFALSGAFAVILGFAFKDVGASALAGLTVLVDSSFQVGDRISFGSWYGEVVDIGLRSVRVRTLDDNLVTIPSNRFLTEVVASANAGALDAMVVMPFPIAADADHSAAMTIVREAVTASKYINMHRPVEVLVAAKLTGAYPYTEVTAKAYVFDIRHERAFASDVTDMVLRTFKAARIRPPMVSLTGGASAQPSAAALRSA